MKYENAGKKCSCSIVGSIQKVAYYYLSHMSNYLTQLLLTHMFLQVKVATNAKDEVSKALAVAQGRIAELEKYVETFKSGEVALRAELERLRSEFEAARDGLTKGLRETDEVTWLSKCIRVVLVQLFRWTSNTLWYH